MIWFIPVDRKTEKIPLETLTFSGIQKAVGGMVEIVTLHDGGILCVDEEARLKPNVRINLGASMLAHFDILGPAVYFSDKKEWTKFNEEGGE